MNFPTNLGAISRATYRERVASLERAAEEGHV